MSQFLGMDPAAVEAKGNQIKTKGGEIRTMQQQITALIDGLEGEWTGNDMRQFRDEYNSSFKGALTNLADGLEQLGGAAVAQAQQQRDTSDR